MRSDAQERPRPGRRVLLHACAIAALWMELGSDWPRAESAAYRHTTGFSGWVNFAASGDPADLDDDPQVFERLSTDAGPARR